jgi:hypothetical protein
MGGVIVGRSPSDEEEQAGRFGAGCAVWVHGYFGVEDGVHLKGIAVDKILGSGDRLIREGPVRELSMRIVSPGQELADMENWVNAGHGGWESKFDSNLRDDGSDSEGTEEARAELGGRVIKECNVLGR